MSENRYINPATHKKCRICRIFLQDLQDLQVFAGIAGLWHACTMVFMLFTKRRLLGSNLNKFLQMAISSSKRDSRSLVEGSLNRLRLGNIFFLKMINYCLSVKTYVCAYILVYLRSMTLGPPTPL